MSEATTNYLIYCSDCNVYTICGRHSKLRGFQGERGTKTKAHDEAKVILSEFLLKHVEHDLAMFNSTEEMYYEVLEGGERFMARDIERVVKAQEEMATAREDELHFYWTLGIRHLEAIKAYALARADEVGVAPAKDEAENQVLLGREMEARYIAEKVDEEYLKHLAVNPKIK